MFDQQITRAVGAVHERGQGNTAGDRPSYLYGGHNIGFDARVDIADWFNPQYDDADWEAAEEKGVPPCKPWGPLEARPIPQWKDFGLRSYTNDGVLPGAGGGGPGYLINRS